jgi:5-formyltetrahydrofolate cyclo-ligase
MISAQQEKAALRHIARQNRRAAHAAKGDISTQLHQHFPYEGMPERGVAVGYWPAGSEASGVDALGVLYEQGWSVYLPHRLEDDGNMDFAAWAPGQEMQPGRLGISIPAGVPAIDLESVDLVVIPLLAFDETGARLGQGGGYFDRALEKWMSAKPVSVIGLAYEEQQLPAIPVEAHDQRLDYVVTDKRLWRFAK